MFTSSMTEDELQAAALQDYLEIRMRVKLAFEQFIKGLRISSGQRRAFHSVYETKTIRTKARNTWNVNFRYIGYNAEGRIFCICLLYLPLRRGETVDYLFMNNLDDFRLEILSSHFLKRYKERYIDFNGINLRGVHPAIYYMLGNEDRSQAFFYPDHWTEEDLKEKTILISSQGLSVIKVNKHLYVYITFLDQENLNRYKALVYEEEQLIKDLRIIAEKQDILHNRALYQRLLANPGLKDVFYRWFRRVSTNINLTVNNASDEFMVEAERIWNKLIEDAVNFQERWDEVVKEMKPKSFYDTPFEDLSKDLHGRI